MAFIEELTNFNLTTFDRDQVEEMMQWYIMQHGSAKNPGRGMLTHYLDKKFNNDRRFHWFYYLEMAEGKEDEGSWRIDMHYDCGKEADVLLVNQQDPEHFLDDEDSRFDSSLPVIWHQGQQELPVIVDLANKNDAGVYNEGRFMANLNMMAFAIDVIHTKKDYNALKKNHELPPIGEFVPTGLVYSVSTAEKDAQRDPQMDDFMRYIAANYRINPMSLSDGIFKIRNIESVEAGPSCFFYDITVDCADAGLHVLVPSLYENTEDLKKGRYLHVSGFLSGMVLPEEDIRFEEKERSNLVQFKPAAGK
jgi:hypothetical protein